MSQDSEFVKRYRTFDLWKAQVDRELMKRCHCTSDGLPDWDYWAAWSRGEEPQITAEEVIENAQNY